MIAIEDPHLPGLAGLDAARLAEVTGSETARPLRLRYRPGERAILQVDGGEDGPQGALWFFRGGKARRIAKRNKAARYDAQTGAVFEPFPHDHRMPQIRAFLDSYDSCARVLTGAPAAGAPRLLRYRPGLSCTFECPIAGRRRVFVKLASEGTPRRTALMNQLIQAQLTGSGVSIAAAIGTCEPVSAIAYDGARGHALDVVLQASGRPACHKGDPVAQAIAALGRIWRLGVTPPRQLTAQVLIGQARANAAMTSLLVPAAAGRVARVLARLEASRPLLNMRPIHGDVKLEHVFLDGAHTTLIDTESLSLGPTDLDLAQLHGRLLQAGMEGHVPAAAEAAAAQVWQAAGPGFGWCRDLTALRLAKFYAQRPTPDSEARTLTMLERLW